ncbi:glutaredoxin family protein [Peribacillus asahii]|uniref:glutaredoxin family protein n=1 Tax=Peribacillus asahii TaxID=228899 RepID=UPI00338D6F82
MNAFQLYSRKKCSLCDQAKLVLEEIKTEMGILYEEIDIDCSDELIERYGMMIPVVQWQGEVVQYGHVWKDELLQRIKR